MNDLTDWTPYSPLVLCCCLSKPSGSVSICLMISGDTGFPGFHLHILWFSGLCNLTQYFILNLCVCDGRNEAFERSNHLEQLFWKKIWSFGEFGTHYYSDIWWPNKCDFKLLHWINVNVFMCLFLFVCHLFCWFIVLFVWKDILFESVSNCRSYFCT